MQGEIDKACMRPTAPQIQPMQWRPLKSPLWVQASGDSKARFLAIAETEDGKQLRAYHISLPYVDTDPKSIAVATLISREPLSLELQRMRTDVKVGASLEDDLILIIADWMELLYKPELEASLINHISAVAALSTDIPNNTQKIIRIVDTVQKRLDKRLIAREPLFGEICGLEYGVVELTRFQIGSIAPPLKAKQRGVHDIKLGIKLGSRHQNQIWRAIVYLRDNKRQTGSLVFDFDYQATPEISVNFTHIINDELWLVIEISALESNGSYSKVACGVHHIPVRSCDVQMWMPFSGKWSNFTSNLIDSQPADKCALISNILVTRLQDSNTSASIPSLVKDGFNAYNAMYLQISDFTAESHTASPYYLRLRAGVSVHVDQHASSLLFSGANSDQCLTLTNLVHDEPIKLELWRGSSMVSVATLPLDRRDFQLKFSSLTTFQSIGLTKVVATLKCNLTVMGGSNHQADTIERIEGYYKQTEDQLLQALRDLDITQQAFEQFRVIAVALLAIMDFFPDNPFIHEAAFIALISLLERGQAYPDSMRQFFEDLPPTSLNRNVLSIVLRQFYLLLGCETVVHRLVSQSSSIKDLIAHLSPGINESIHASEFSLTSDKSSASVRSRAASRYSSLRSLHTLRSSIRLAKKGQFVVPTENIPDIPETDQSWRAMSVVEQVREIVEAMQVAYSAGSNATKLALIKNTENIFEAFKKLLGESAALLLFSFLSGATWVKEVPEINTEKLFLLARVSKSWNFDSTTSILFSNLCINSVAPVWVGKRDSRRWIDVRATASILNSLLEIVDLNSLCDVYSEFLPLTIDISSDLALLDPEEFKNRECDEVFPLKTNDDNIATTAIEMMLLIQQLLLLESKTTVSSLSQLGQSHLRQIILKAIDTCQFWLETPILHSTWYSLRLVQLNSIYGTLEYVSKILSTYFLPSPDANIHFDTSVWYKFFLMLNRLIIHPDLVRPENAVEAACHQKIAGNTLQRSIMLLGKIWGNLLWKHPISEQASTFYGYHVNLFCCPNNLTASFVELAFSEQARVAVKPILRQIVCTEWILNESLDDITIEFLEALDALFMNRSKRGERLPAPEACDIFIEMVCHEEGQYQRFMSTIKSYLQLLCDNYRHDSLLTLCQNLKFLKKNFAISLFHRYIGFILTTEKNYRVLGLAFVELASIYSWDDNCVVPPMQQPPFPHQRASDRKEKLLVMASQCFQHGHHWLLAIDVDRACLNYYERTLDYRKSSLVSAELSMLYERMTVEKYILPNYYCVSFGGGFGGLSNRQFIFEQPPSTRLDDFTAQTRAKYVGGQITIQTVEAVSNISYNEHTVMPWLMEALKTKVSQFTYSKPLAHCDVLEMWVEKTVFTTNESLPTICGQSEITSTKVVRLSPLENALEVVMSRNIELRMICGRHNSLDLQDKTDVYLELILGSTLSSPVNGGLEMYRELLKRSEPTEPGYTRLKDAFEELRETTRGALEVYSQVIQPSMRPQYDYFVELFRSKFDHIQTTSIGASTMQRHASEPHATSLGGAPPPLTS